MTAARLEELAVWAQSQADWCAGQDLPPDIGAKYADLARCVRAWAKVERMKGQVSMEHTVACYFWRNQKGQGDYSTGPTAIEAVEAAGKDNLNG